MSIGAIARHKSRFFDCIFFVKYAKIAKFLNNILRRVRHWFCWAYQNICINHQKKSKKSQAPKKICHQWHCTTRDLMLKKNQQFAYFFNHLQKNGQMGVFNDFFNQKIQQMFGTPLTITKNRTQKKILKLAYCILQ